MHRTLFFLIEKLEIRRGERIAVTCLLILLVITTSMYSFRQPKDNYDPEHYAALELIFTERSLAAEQEREIIMSRYRPATAAPEPETALLNEPSPIAVQPDTSTISESHDAEGSHRININRATAQQLQQLPGIGPAYAQRIVEWREENGPFTEKEQLLEIRGIGVRRLEALISLITL